MFSRFLSSPVGRRRTGPGTGRTRAGRFRAARPLVVEALESRRLLHAEGFAWADAPDLTLSFAPDGTRVGDESSALYASMDEIAPAGDWQASIVRAFRVWADHADADITVVGDTGDAFGTPGPRQADPRFGDIRVGAVPLPDDVIALSVPHDEVVSGTWTGDLLFNSNADLQSIDDVFAVTVHEAGHVFGLGHSTDPLSPMFRHGIPTIVTPTAQDIRDLQSLYGVLAPDGRSGETDGGDLSDDEVGEHTNDQLGAAGVITVAPKFVGGVRYQASGQIADSSDVDFFHLAPAAEEYESFDVLTVTLRSRLPDRLIPYAAVFNHEGEVVKGRILASANGEFILQVKDADPDEGYYVMVVSDPAESEFSTGAYQLDASFGHRRTQLMELDEGSLSADKPVRVATLHVPETGLVHLALKAKKVEDASVPAIWAVIYDADGQMVYRVAAKPGETRSSNSVLLDAGVYRVELRLNSPDGSDVPSVKYELVGASTSIPIGPGVIDPTGSPVLPCDNPSADPNSCLPPELVIADPAVIPTPLPPPPEPVVIVNPPWFDTSWWYWNALGTQSVQTLGGRWHNPSNSLDVNQDGKISALDALAVINYVNRTSVGLLPAPSSSTLLLDVNNDGYATAVDAIMVINQLNAAGPAGEGEAAVSKVAPTRDRSMTAYAPGSANLPVAIDSGLTNSLTEAFTPAKGSKDLAMVDRLWQSWMDWRGEEF